MPSCHLSIKQDQHNLLHILPSCFFRETLIHDLNFKINKSSLEILTSSVFKFDTPKEKTSADLTWETTSAFRRLSKLLQHWATSCTHIKEP